MPTGSRVAPRSGSSTTRQALHYRTAQHKRICVRCLPRHSQCNCSSGRQAFQGSRYHHALACLSTSFSRQLGTAMRRSGTRTPCDLGQAAPLAYSRGSDLPPMLSPRRKDGMPNAFWYLALALSDAMVTDGITGLPAKISSRRCIVFWQFGALCGISSGFDLFVFMTTLMFNCVSGTSRRARLRRRA